MLRSTVNLSGKPTCPPRMHVTHGFARWRPDSIIILRAPVRLPASESNAVRLIGGHAAIANAPRTMRLDPIMEIWTMPIAPWFARILINQASVSDQTALWRPAQNLRPLSS